MDLFAQWQKVADIGSMVKSIYFLDEVGRPHIGFAASQRGVVIRTSDRGKTWNSCVFNGNPGGEAIYDFTFKDSLRGWCAGSGLFTTTDGGMTWETVGNHPSISGCYYNRYSKLLFISHALANGKMSPDDGTTWANILPPLMLGFAFVDSLHGISTTYLGLHYYTSDGGYTWNRSEFGSESYQPVAVKGTSSFLSVSEGFIGTNSIYQTNNYGATWAPIYQTGSQSLLTGTIHGSRDTFYVQSNNGMQFTIDRGRSWHFICGPDNYFDNRFWSSGDTVFAGDRTGGVWITNHATSRPENALLAIDPPPPYSLGVSECTELIHSFKVTIADNCEPSQVQIQNIEINGTNNFVLLSPATLPKLVATDESIKIAYRPSTLLFDTASVTITYSQLGTSRETTFNIYGSRIPGGKKVSILPQEIQKNVNNPCQNLDTTIQIKANRCDTLEISSFFLPSGMVFISTPPQLPYYLPPDSILTIPIQASVLASGLFTDTLHLNLKNKDTSFAEQIPLQFSVKNNIPISAMYTPPRMSFGRVSICTTSTKQLKITNNTCANFTITALSWATPSGDVSLSSVFPLPRTLIPGESDSLLILFAPQTIGTKQVTLRVTLERDSVKRDTIISIHAIGTTAVEAFFSDSAAVLEPILTCQSALDTVYISNASCEQVTINEINYDLTKGFTVLSPLLTTTIPPTDSIPVVIHYSSTVGSNVSIPIEFRLRSSTSGIETAATIQAQATTIERGDSVSVLPKVIVFDSTSVCSDASDFFSAKNLSSCDSLLITSVTLDGGDPSFMINPSTSVLLTPGDSIRFPISFSPAEDGWHSTNITIHFKTRTREWDTVISVGGFGSGKKRIVSCDVVSIDLGKHSICTELDTSITLRNDGCEPLTINSSILNGTGFTIADITTPIIIPAKTSYTFPLHSYIDTAGGALLSSA
ncbi:MAG TPA: choice-of-anchor D domain-containing protein, partial [Candidatus Kapabacteria bacterium]